MSVHALLEVLAATAAAGVSQRCSPKNGDALSKSHGATKQCFFKSLQQRGNCRLHRERSLPCRSKSAGRSKLFSTESMQCCFPGATRTPEGGIFTILAKLAAVYGEDSARASRLTIKLAGSTRASRVFPCSKHSWTAPLRRLPGLPRQTVAFVDV